MSGGVSGGNSYRTPLDFSLAGTFPSNCTQLAIMRTTMARENAAILQQAQMKALQDQQDQSRYWSALQAVRDRDHAAAAKEEQAQMAKQRAKQRHEVRKAKVAAFSYSSQIFPFSSHRQRIPPPTLPQRNNSTNNNGGAIATSRTARTQQRRGGMTHHRAPPPMTEHEARLFQQQQQQQQQSYQPYPPQQHFSSTYNPSHSSQTEYGEQSQYPESARHSHSFSSTAHPTSSSTARPPMLHSDGFEGGKPRFDSSTVFGRPSFKEPLPLPFNARPKVEITPLPYSSEQLQRMGQRPVQHPFYEYGTRLSNADDEEYSRMVNERYRRDVKEVMPHDRVPTPTKLPPNFDINGWSVEHGAHRKRCRETAIEEFLISKGYL